MAQHDQDIENSTYIPKRPKEAPRKSVIATGRYMPSRVPTDVAPWVLEFRVVGSADILRAPAAESFFFGRRDDARNIYPDIDLAPHSGREEGVSREHARILARDNRILIQDLGSSNGTFINGVQVSPDTPTRLRDGDELRLGFLNLQVHFIIKPKIEDHTIIGFEDAMPIPRIGGGQHLMVLDDNVDACRVLRFVGSRAGFRITIVHTMTEAIAKLETEDYDGLILELMLPDGSGLDVVRYLRQKIKADMPIIAMSAMDGFIVNKARAQGANHFMNKPISVDDLIEQIRVFSA